MTKEEANKRLTELTEQVKQIAIEAEQLCIEHQLEFQLIDGREGGVWFNGSPSYFGNVDNYQDYGWHSSSTVGC